MVFAPALPGDIVNWELDGRTVYLQSGSYLASSQAIDIDSKWGGSKTFFSREGLFMLKCTGTGNLLVSSYGAIATVDLADGESYVVDSGHMVGWDEGVRLRGAQGRQLEEHDPRRRGVRRGAHRSGSGLHPDPEPGRLPRLADPEAADATLRETGHDQEAMAIRTRSRDRGCRSAADSRAVEHPYVAARAHRYEGRHRRRRLVVRLYLDRSRARAGAEPVGAALGVLLGVTLLSLFVATLVGLGMRRRWGIGLALVRRSLDRDGRSCAR